jgi:hypothetical protein
MVYFFIIHVLDRSVTYPVIKSDKWYTFPY